MNRPRYYVVTRENLGEIGHSEGEDREAALKSLKAAIGGGEEVVVVLGWEVQAVSLPTYEEVLRD